MVKPKLTIKEKLRDIFLDILEILAIIWFILGILLLIFVALFLFSYPLSFTWGMTFLERLKLTCIHLLILLIGVIIIMILKR